MAKRRTTRYSNAIGLSYHAHSDDAPRVSIKGEQREADEIVRLANRFGVPVIKKKELARALKALDLDENVPSQLFEAIALVIAQLDRKIK